MMPCGQPDRDSQTRTLLPHIACSVVGQDVSAPNAVRAWVPAKRRAQRSAHPLAAHGLARASLRWIGYDAVA